MEGVIEVGREGGKGRGRRRSEKIDQPTHIEIRP